MIVAAPSRPRRLRQVSRDVDQALLDRAKAILGREISFISSDSFARRGSDGAETATADRGVNLEIGQPQSRHASGQSFLASLCRTPLLTPEQEREAFFRMNFLKYRANCLRSSLSDRVPDRGTVDAIEAMLEEATAIRNRIIEANVRLVMSIAKQFADQKNRFDELFSEGVNCLIKAVDKFNFDRGFRFSTYATRAVRREIFRLVKRLHRDRSRYSSGADETIAKQIERRETPAGIGSSWQEVDRTVRESMEMLDERERMIVAARYGFERLGQKATFQYLGKLLGVSKERARQLEQRALEKMRQSAAVMALDTHFA